MITPMQMYWLVKLDDMMKALANAGVGGERVELAEQSSTIRTGTKAKKGAR